MPELLQIETGRRQGAATDGAGVSAPAAARRHLVAVSLLVVVVVALKAWQGYEWDLRLNGPFCLSDELIYKQNAQAANGDSGRSYNPQYPPDYPLLLAVALRFEAWYRAILLINSLLTGLSVLLIWLLAHRFLPPAWALAMAVLFAVSPFHSVFPVMVMSENLALPVLLASFCVLVSLRRNSPAWWHALFGALLLVNWTVKFIGLVQIPGLALAWIVMARRRGFLRLSPVVSVLSGGAVVLVVWLAFGWSHGLPLRRTLFGPFDVTSFSLESALFLKWLGLYSAYVLLAMGPLLPFVIRTLLTSVTIGNSEEVKTRQDLRFLFLLFLSLGIGLVLISARHSTLALYNQPQPQYLLGRYLIALPPLGLLLGTVSLYAVRLRGRPYPAATVAALSLWLPAAWLAQAVLVDDLLGLGLSSHFTGIPFNTPEVGTLRAPECRWLLLAIGGASLVAAAATSGRRRWGQATMAAVILGSGGWMLLDSTRVSVKVWEMGSAGIHARVLARHLGTALELSGRTEGIRLDPAIRNVQRPVRMVEALRFWGVTGDIAVSMESDCSLDTSEIRVELSLETRCLGPRFYLANGQRVYVCMQDGDPDPAPCILDFGPRMAEAGTVFNPQAHGHSGLWFRVRNVRRGTELLFNGMPLRPTVMRSDLTTAALPPSAYPAPGTYPLQFRDPDTRVMSNTVFLDVK
jgi:hypothetical protein